MSFDRPYAKEFGAGQFLRDELGVVAAGERLGLPLDYITDIDLQADPHILDGARAAVSMGHDEYYSPRMRAVLEAARGRGINLAFFGANAIYRRIRFASSTLGPLRLGINYKVATEDPLYGVDNSAVTADWPSYPAARPESSLIGAQYGCYFGLVSNVPGVVSKPRSWLFARVHVMAGEVLPGLIGLEIDSIRNGYPQPPGPVDVIMRSPARCPYGEPTTADTTYYTARSGAGVFDAATISWACVVGPQCAGLSNQRTHGVVRQVTDDILRAFAVGPAGRRHPS